MQKKLKAIIAFLIGCVCGIFALIFFKRLTSFSLDKNISLQINPIEIISIIVNLLLAIYVTSILSKRNEKEKSQKDLLVNYLKEFQVEFSVRTNKLIEKIQFDAPNTNLCFKYLRTKIHSIISIAKETNLIRDDEPLSNSITQKVTDIWTYFTDTPQKPSPKVSQATRESMETLRLEKVSKIESSCIELDKLIYQLAIKINEK